MIPRLLPSREYRQWLRTGIRLFDERESILRPGEYINNLHMDDLEVAAEILGLDWRRVAPAYRR